MVPTYSTTQGTSQSQYVIPGAAQNYQAVLGGVMGGYANLQQQVTGGLSQLYNAGMADAKNFGMTDAARINNAYLQARGQQAQQLVSRGLGNTTVQQSVDTGLLQNRELNLTANAEAAARQRLAARTSLGLPVYQAMQGIGMQSLNAQQALGQQYLNMIAQQGVHSQSFQQQQTQWNPGGFGGAGGGGGASGAGGGGWSNQSMGLHSGAGGIADYRSQPGEGAYYQPGGGGYSPYGSLGMTGYAGGGGSYGSYGGGGSLVDLANYGDTGGETWG